MSFPDKTYVLAFDTANEVIAIGVGQLVAANRLVEPVATVEVEAHRASNTQLLPCIDNLCSEQGINRNEIACVAVGRGPGSFTGVRIAMATAKGIAEALSVGLIGLSTLDSIAWNVYESGVRGSLEVIADAMRKEVYPVRYLLRDTSVGDEFDSGVERLEADRVLKAELAANELEESSDMFLAGDALKKYGELFSCCGQVVDEQLWTPTGRGLLLALQAAWRAGNVDPFDKQRHNPAFALPVYTRLSDAEENERIRLAKNDPKNLTTGVQEPGLRRDQRVSMNDTAILNAQPDEAGITYKPLDGAHVADVAALETRIMSSDAWSEFLVADELPRPDRTWWAAYRAADEPDSSGTGSVEPGSSGTGSGEPNVSRETFSAGNVTLQSGEPRQNVSRETTDTTDTANRSNTTGLTSKNNELGNVHPDNLQLIGYAGGLVVDGQLQILKVGVDPSMRRCGIARNLLARIASDARDLGATSCSLEVRASNTGAQAFYEALDFRKIGKRSRYYSDGEDALIFEGPLPLLARDVAGMHLLIDAARSSAIVSRETLSNVARPLILAIESSCDETAAAIVDGNGNLVADVVASQVDFHSRFGGVVPEIASRKHIEAICGVCDECFDVAAANLGVKQLAWPDLDAVAATYAPGLVGALVVGVAFAKGAAWAADLPFIGVHHLEGHLYANKIGTPDFEPPAVVSLVSGGNTLLVYMKDWGSYETLGATIDDAVGEAFDKVAKALGLGYPGGPVISKYAANGNPDAIPFPRAMMHSGDLRFSLSGLKTAVITYINKERDAGNELNIGDIAASFQQAVIDVQIKKAETALMQTGAPTFCLGGGVAANPALREAYEQLCDRLNVRLVMPPYSACGDNAGMIALVALDRYEQNKFFSLDADAYAHANLDEPY